MPTAKEIPRKEIEKPDAPNLHDPAHAHELAGTLGMAAVGVATGIAGGVVAVKSAAIGAALGITAGPVGIVAGAAIGGALGGAAGEALASMIDPTEEEKYWEENYRSRPYVKNKTRDFETYRTAYRYGIDAYRSNPGRKFHTLESTLRNNWVASRGESYLEWAEARNAARDAFNRLHTYTINAAARAKNI